MSVERNMESIRVWFEEAVIQNKQNKPELVEQLFMERIVVHGKNDQVSEQTKADKRSYIEAGNSSFTDFKISYDDPPPFGSGDYLAVRWVASGSVKKTGDTFCYVHNYLYRFENEKIAEEWHCYF